MRVLYLINSDHLNNSFFDLFESIDFFIEYFLSIRDFPVGWCEFIPRHVEDFIQICVYLIELAWMFVDLAESFDFLFHTFLRRLIFDQVQLRQILLDWFLLRTATSCSSATTTAVLWLLTLVVREIIPANVLHWKTSTCLCLHANQIIFCDFKPSLHDGKHVLQLF